MRRAVEVRSAVADPGCPPEVVDGDRVDAALREAQRQLAVVGVQAAHVGQDHDPGAGGLGGMGDECREPGTVGGVQSHALTVDRRPGQGSDRGSAVKVETHGRDATLGAHDSDREE